MKSKARMAKTRWRRLFCRKQVLQYTIMYTKICTTGRLFFLSSHAQLMRVKCLRLIIIIYHDRVQDSSKIRSAFKTYLAPIYICDSLILLGFVDNKEKLWEEAECSSENFSYRDGAVYCLLENDSE
jgi:hypothetical protein